MKFALRSVVLATVLALAAPVVAVCAGSDLPPARHACCPEEVAGAAPMVPDMADACCRQADDAAGRALSPALVVMAAPPPEAMAAGLAASALDVHRRVVTGPTGSPPDHAVPKYLRFSVFLV